MDKPRHPNERDASPREPSQERQTFHPPKARHYLGGGGGRLPDGEEGPDVVATDAGIAHVQEYPEDIPGESPDHERSPSRGGWHF